LQDTSGCAKAAQRTSDGAHAQRMVPCRRLPEISVAGKEQKQNPLNPLAAFDRRMAGQWEQRRLAIAYGPVIRR
jgi:hypothetical protein